MSGPRVVLVGMHGHGRVHLTGLLARERAGTLDLVGIADRRPPDFATDVRGREFDTDAVALLARTRPDIAVLVTPIHTHAALAEAALRAGAHVLLEKPPVTSLAEHDRLLAVAAETERHCQVGFQAFGSSSVAELRGILARGEIGAVRRIGVVGCWQRGYDYYARAPWAGHRVLAGTIVADGALTNPFAHGLALALRLADAPVRAVTVQPWHAYDIETDDTATARIDTAAGVTVTVAVTLCAAQEFEPYVRVHGSAGTATIHYTADRLTVDTGCGPVTTTGRRVDLVDDLIAHLAADPAGAALCCPLRDTRAFTEVLAAIQHSPDPARIPDEYLRISATGRTIPGIEEAVGAAAEHGLLFSELGLPWAKEFC